MKPNIELTPQTVGQVMERLSTPGITLSKFSVDVDPSLIEKMLTAAYCAAVKQRGRRRADLDEATCSHLHRVAMWMASTNDRPGLLLGGWFGNGKSTMIEAIRRVIEELYDSSYASERRRLVVVEALEVARLGSNEACRKEFEQLFAEPMLAIDDMGNEPAEVLRFGMPYYPVREVLYERHKRYLMTIAATNLRKNRRKKIDELADHYGPRVSDRVSEIMESIAFTNKSYRQSR